MPFWKFSLRDRTEYWCSDRLITGVL
jgi:hypothetical protein